MNGAEASVPLWTPCPCPRPAPPAALLLWHATCAGIGPEIADAVCEIFEAAKASRQRVYQGRDGSFCRCPTCMHFA